MTDISLRPVLALDTAQEDCGASLLLSDGRLFTRVERVGSGHSERLLPMVRDLLAEAGVDKSEIGLVAFGAGPGSFTGLRVACGCAQGLAWALEVDTAPVSNLEAQADWMRHTEGPAAGTVIAVLNDARMHECYAGAWRVPAGADDRLELVDGPVLVKPEAAREYVERTGAGRVCGSGPLVYAKEMALGDIPHASAFASHPEAIARIARKMLAAGETVRPELAHPVYVRNRVALTMAERAAGERL